MKESRNTDVGMRTKATRLAFFITTGRRQLFISQRTTQFPASLPTSQRNLYCSTLSSKLGTIRSTSNRFAGNFLATEFHLINIIKKNRKLPENFLSGLLDRRLGWAEGYHSFNLPFPSGLLKFRESNL